MIRAEERPKAEPLRGPGGSQLLLIAGPFLRLREDSQLHRWTIASSTVRRCKRPVGRVNPDRHATRAYSCSEQSSRRTCGVRLFGWVRLRGCSRGSGRRVGLVVGLSRTGSTRPPDLLRLNECPVRTGCEGRRTFAFPTTTKPSGLLRRVAAERAGESPRRQGEGIKPKSHLAGYRLSALAAGAYSDAPRGRPWRTVGRRRGRCRL